MSSPLRGVLLDVDGTLIDSNPAHALAWVDTFREFGFEISREAVQPLIGKGGDKLLPQLTGVDPESELGKKMNARRGEVFTRDYLPTLKAFPEAHELLARFKRAGLRMVIATSASRKDLGGLLAQAGLDELADRETTSSDAEQSKPDPDIIVAALNRGALTPQDAIMVGDTPWDIEAATRAGVRAVAFRSGGWDDASLSGAIAIYDGPSELLREFDQSVFGNG